MSVPPYPSTNKRWAMPFKHSENCDLQPVVASKPNQPWNAPFIFFGRSNRRRTAIPNSPTTACADSHLAQFRGLATRQALSIWPAARPGGSPNVPCFAAHSVSHATAPAIGRAPSRHSLSR